MPRVVLAFLLSVFLVEAATAQPVIVRPDPYIARLVDRVSADTLEANIRRLASFGTRHTMAPTASDTFGIGAARRWIKSAMERYAEAGGGRMEVYFDAFLYEADERRIDRDVVLKNVVARLPGTDPADDRIFLVSGHYDSRATGIMDSLAYAPGASDDAR